MGGAAGLFRTGAGCFSPSRGARALISRNHRRACSQPSAVWEGAKGRSVSCRNSPAIHERRRARQDRMTSGRHWPSVLHMWRRRHLIGWLTALLLIQWVGGYGHCRLWQAEGFTLEICTAEGLQRITIPGDDGPAKPAGDVQECAACHALPSVACPAAPGASTRIAWASTPSWRPEPFVTVHALARPPPPPSRAPPAFS